MKPLGTQRQGSNVHYSINNCLQSLSGTLNKKSLPSRTVYNALFLAGGGEGLGVGRMPCFDSVYH